MNAQATLGIIDANPPAPAFDLPALRKPTRGRTENRWSMSLMCIKEELTDDSGQLIKTRDPEAISRLMNDIRNLAQEAMIVVDINTRHNVIDKRLVCLGILNASPVHPREVFRGAIANAAAAVIICHNHPSGDPTPSAEDLRITHQLVDAGRILDIRVLDHVIIGRAIDGHADHISLREAGLVNFDA